MATVWTTMEKTENGRYVESGFHTTEPENWLRCINVDDPEDFIAHMLRFRSISSAPLSRDEYEEMCKEYGVAPLEEAALDFYGTTSSSMGTHNYRLHADPETRGLATANRIHELRYRAIMRSQLAK